jgi:hypothetical protein
LLRQLGTVLSKFQSEPSPAGVPGEILILLSSPPCSPRVTIHPSIASTPIKVLAATDLPLTVDLYATVRVSWSTRGADYRNLITPA